METKSTAWDWIAKRGDILFSSALLGTVLFLILPLSPLLIDFFLTVSISISVLIILAVSYARDPVDFYVFPTVLLFSTLFRLGLNIATTRAILSTGQAGNLIATFGHFVVGGNMLVGIIVFTILTIINFVVITKGAGRVAEVSARFTLDAMPGKQMSIDADLNAGLISEQEARHRREKLERDASFFGSMDGASKFVRGDAIAAILIVAINLVGGFGVGIVQMGLSLAQSVQKFSILSIGDGLVTQIPALLVSTAAGILVTRSSSKQGLGEDVTRQLLGSWKSVTTTGLLLWVMVLIPGFPKMILFLLGALFVVLGRILPRVWEPSQGATPIAKGAASSGGRAGAPAASKEPEETSLRVEPLALELGLNLILLAQGGTQNLVEKLGALRRNLGNELGISIPAIFVRDNPSLPANHYRLLLRGHEIARSELYPGQLLAMGATPSQRPLKGRLTREPTFGMPSTWISETDRREAELLGYAVVDPLAVLSTHICEALRENAADLLSRQETQKILDRLKETNPAVIQETANLQVGVGMVHRVMQNILRERVSIRDAVIIVEKICDMVAHTKNQDELSEACRKALRLEITRKQELQDGKLHAITLHPEVEQQIAKCVRQTPQEIALVLEPTLARHLHGQFSAGIKEMLRAGANPVLICSPSIRLGLKRFFGDTFANLGICSYSEISPKIPIHPVFTIAPAPAPQSTLAPAAA